MSTSIQISQTPSLFTLAPDPKAAMKCRAAADAMQKLIDAKYASAQNTLSKPPTRKRMQEAESASKNAQQMEKVQYVLRTLAEGHETGTVEIDLKKVTSKAAVETALFEGDPTIRALFTAAPSTEQPEDKARALESQAMLSRVPGFFPTPPAIADQLVSNLGMLTSGMRVLEPSAGSGRLMDAVLRVQPKAEIHYFELNYSLRELLNVKFANQQNLLCAGFNFDNEALEQWRKDKKPLFDRILLNPPFEKYEDVLHTRRAYELLAPGGVMASIVSEGPFGRSDAKSVAFREWLDEVGAMSTELPSDSFKTSGTGVSCRIIRIQKPIKG